MAVSGNGSMGLGGDAEGFEIANQGVTRRRPGEGPKANGGRSQLQTMDSYDQPQYKEAIEVPTGDDAYDGGGWDYDDTSDPFGMNQACNRCGSLGNWDNATCPNCEPETDAPTVGPEQNEQHCPSCDGNGGECDGCGGAGTFEAYLNAEAGRGMNEEMPNFNGGDAEGWDRQIAQGITNPGRDVSDEKPPQLEAGNINQAVDDWLNSQPQDKDRYGPTGKPPVLQPPRKPFDPNQTTGTAGYDFTQDNSELIKMLGLTQADEGPLDVKEMFEGGPDEVGGERIVWSPGEYGSDTKKVLKYLDKESWGGNSIWLKLNQSGPHAMIDLEQEEAMALSNALTQFLKTMRYDTKNVNLAEDVIEQIEEKFGELPAPQGFYEGKEETLKKSSEKEQGEHPWASKKVATKIAKDHMKLGEVFRFRKVKP